jgi:hypothetical protein
MPQLSRVVARGAVALAVCVWSGCAGDTAGRTIRSDSAGITILTHDGPDRRLDWILEPLDTIGGEDSGPGSFYRVRAGLVDVDERGWLYVLDPSASTISAFDGTGQPRWTAGRPGGGPGELLSPLSLSVVAADILVYDARKRALLNWDTAGRHVREIPFGYQQVVTGVRVVRRHGSGLAVLARERYTGSDDRNVTLLHIEGDDTTTLFSAPLDLSRTASYPSCGMSLTMPVLFAPAVHWSGNANEFVMVRGAEYAIDVFSATGERRSIRRTIEPEPVTEERALEALGGTGLEGGPLAPCRTDAATRLRNHGYAPFIQVIRDLALEPGGRLWVRRVVAGDTTSIIDIVDADGSYAGSLAPGTAFPLVFLPAARVGYVAKDTLDVERLIIARVPGR